MRSEGGVRDEDVRGEDDGRDEGGVRVRMCEG